MKIVSRDPCACCGEVSAAWIDNLTTSYTELLIRTMVVLLCAVPKRVADWQDWSVSPVTTILRRRIWKVVELLVKVSAVTTPGN